MAAWLCPNDAPFMLKQQYNTNTGFRLSPGVEFPDYKPGLDAAVDSVIFVPTGNQKVGVGLTGQQEGPLANSAMNWSFSDNSFRMTLHCTSDRSKALVVPRG